MTVLSRWKRRRAACGEAPAAGWFVASIELEVSLMRAHPWDGALVPCGWRCARWFVEAPAAWRADRQRLRDAVDEILHLESRRLASAHGQSLSYLVLGRTKARPAVIAPGASPPWETAPLEPAWERSACWASSDAGDPECWVPLSPRQLTLLGFLRQAVDGTLSVGPFADVTSRWFAVSDDQARAWYERRHDLLCSLLQVGRPSPAIVNAG